MDIAQWVGIALGSYLLGSLPFGFWIAKIFFGVDIRQHGSGNIGATNVMRVLGKKAGILVFALDVLKGWFPSFLTLQVTGQEGAGLLAGACAVAGHSLSPFLKFKGGKGVATGLGLLLGVAPITAVTGLSFWFLVLFVTRYVSVASILAAISVPVSAYLLGFQPVTVIALSAAASLVLWRHRENIQRLLQGKETKIGRKPASSSSLQHACIDLARRAVESYAREGARIEPDLKQLPAELALPGGVFVAIYQDGDLRSMSGSLEAEHPNRAKEIVYHAARAVVLDPRNLPIEPPELPTLEYVVYLLETSEPLTDAKDLDPARDGVLIEWQDKQGAMMPATKGVESAEQQIELARARAGIPREAYAQVYRLRVRRLG